ncbi:type II secretion system protein [Curvibacter sp. HBC28]|uniref:Type II secretion system protein n=1 Tax=Curvibacter microcysteis TaxID=3026419 RepID=A0ABT5MC23_9BURK|nr:type II secretion system protein [Curvibacter sp. HBC28]MDD0813467.1 type II secretion system protein [Curvibacter sp. HBC28]
MSGPLSHHSRGFSLLELLVAIAIMGMAMGLLYRASGGSARSVGQAEAYQRAAVVLESLLSARDAVPDIGVNESGRSAGYEWAVRSEPWTQGGGLDPRAVPLHRVFMTVRWLDGERWLSLDAVTLLPQRKPVVPGG